MVSIRKTKKTFTTANRKILEMQLESAKGTEKTGLFINKKEESLFKKAADADHKLKGKGINIRDSNKVLKTMVKMKTKEVQELNKNKTLGKESKYQATESALGTKEYALRKLRER